MANPEFKYSLISNDEARRAAESFFGIKPNSVDGVGHESADELGPAREIMLMRLEGLPSDEIRRRVGNLGTPPSNFEHVPQMRVTSVGNGMTRVEYADGKVVHSRDPWL